MSAVVEAAPHPTGAGAMRRFRVLGVRVDAVTPVSVVAAVEQAIEAKAKSYVVFSTVSSVLSARDDDRVRAAMEGAGIVTPDGMPLVWLGRRAGLGAERVYGPDFMLALFAATGPRLRHFFYGGAPGVAEEMAARLTQRFPGLVVAGTHCPTVASGAELLEDDVALINAARPDVVWVGLGHPKQELWMETHREALDAPVLAGVGAAFDFHSGRKREAPSWVKRNGLQWLHRLASDPRRLWRRYLVGNARFVWLLARERAVPGGNR
ncbi:MAG: WecB/TagA/CpsF family glycosyltransferase [Actinomycetota bacterium]|nr:WecB/TagA/CpsF family glycosyltransferase [Actinomycetota bacterium]